MSLIASSTTQSKNLKLLQLDMTTKQPSYWCVANIGDATPLEHGGKFVLVDRTGVYSPVMLVLEVHDNQVAPSCNHTLHHVELEPCFIVHPSLSPEGKKCLSTNKFHTGHVEWFGDPESLQSMASFVGCCVDELVDDLISGSPVNRATGYDVVASYHGLDNFDLEPGVLNPEKAKALVYTMLAQIEESRSWHEGYGVQW